jgi:tRNA threonylcarbamoyladenosine biosynthesis protein TsaE
VKTIPWSQYISNSASETEEVGLKFAKFVSGGDIFALTGDLASGKTTFLRGVIKGLGYDGPVTSPTFTLINEYSAANKIIHIDCYREQNIERWIDLGIIEYFNYNYIVFIEWADILFPMLPENSMKFNFFHSSENVRTINLTNQ